MTRLRTPLMATLALSFLSVGMHGPAQSNEPKPSVSPDPLTAEQLAVYKTILHGWMDDDKSNVNLASQTDVFPASSSDCLKGMEMETEHAGVIHRFRPADLAQLGSNHIRLVEAEAQDKEVSDNDPGKAIRNGASVDDAVARGFAHGKVWLSEIRFDKTHTHAVVFYGFVCGGLCGNGGTVILEKTAKGWKRRSQCSEWMS